MLVKVTINLNSRLEESVYLKLLAVQTFKTPIIVVVNAELYAVHRTIE